MHQIQIEVAGKNVFEVGHLLDEAPSYISRRFILFYVVVSQVVDGQPRKAVWVLDDLLEKNLQITLCCNLLGCSNQWCERTTHLDRVETFELTACEHFFTLIG